MAELTRRDLLARRLRRARKATGLSQAEVGKRLGLHRPSISEMEAGRRGVQAEELWEMANIYNADLYWLLDG